MIRHLRDRAATEALQDALERYRTLLAASGDEAAARRDASKGLDAEVKAAFALATALPRAREVAPGAAFADALEARIRAEEMPKAAVVRPAAHLRAVLAAAAAIIVLGGVMVPALHSLPGDRLYPLKAASESARVLFSSGSGEARVRIALANERYREVEKLIARSRLRMTGFGTQAASADVENLDPALATVIKSTLQDAAAEVARAADILIAQPQHDVGGLDQLVEVTRRGQSLAENVAAVVPHQDKTPVLHTLVSLAKIEAQATAARMTVEPMNTPAPCATPTAAPTAAPNETPAETPSATPTETPATGDATPSPTPTTSPEATPCSTPVPAATSTPGADDNVTTTSEPTASPPASDAPPGSGATANQDPGPQPSSDGSTAQSAGQAGIPG